MDETLQRRFIMLLCLKCNGDLENLNENELACALRISQKDLQETKKIFIEKHFIDENWNVLNWDKRQYRSDLSTERVRKYRAKKEQEKNGKNETLQKRYSNSEVTPPDTDTDTDIYIYKRSTSEFSQKKTPTSSNDKKENIKEKIKKHRERYTDTQLQIIDKAINDFRLTRKTNSMSDNLILIQYSRWERYPPEIVISGLERYIENKYFEQGKDENYAYGIIRNLEREVKNGKIARNNKKNNRPDFSRPISERDDKYAHLYK